MLKVPDVDLMDLSKVLLSVFTFIYNLFPPIISFQISSRYTAHSIASVTAKASASRVDLATLFAFLDFQNIVLFFPKLSLKLIKYPI